MPRPRRSTTPAHDRLFDRLNLRIMEAVRADPSMPTRSIARSLGVAQSTVRLRLKELDRSRALRTIAVVNARQAGYPIFATLGIQTDSRKVERVAREIVPIPEVILLTRVSGPFSLSAWIMARDRRHLGRLVADQLGKIRHVQHIEGDISLDVLKYEIHLAGREAFDRFRVSIDNVDALESKIIERLHESAQTPISRIARDADVADGTVRSRVQRLQEAGVLSIRAVSDPVATGRSHVSFLGIRVSPSRFSAASEKIAELREVRFLTFLLGRNSLLGIVAVESHDAFATFLEETLARVDGVEQTEAAQILSVIKFDDRWVL